MCTLSSSKCRIARAKSTSVQYMCCVHLATPECYIMRLVVVRRSWLHSDKIEEQQPSPTGDKDGEETMLSVAGLEQYVDKIVSSSIRNYVLCCCDPRPEQSLPMRYIASVIYIIQWKTTVLCRVTAITHCISSVMSHMSRGSKLQNTEC